MSIGLNIREAADLDFLSLGALVHRLDPGNIPFHKATECAIHVSQREYDRIWRSEKLIRSVRQCSCRVCL